MADWMDRLVGATAMQMVEALPVEAEMEAEADAKERAEATKYRLELKETLANMRSLQLSSKKAGAESSRERRTRALERAERFQLLPDALGGEKRVLAVANGVLAHLDVVHRVGRALRSATAIRRRREEAQLQLEVSAHLTLAISV